MRLRKQKWIIRTAAAVCIAVQALVIVPHHHHGDSEAPCFNIDHCANHTQEHDEDRPGCCHDHCTPEQEPVSGHQCSVKIDAAQVVSEYSYRAILCEISLINDFFAPEPIISPELTNSIHSFTLTRWRQQPCPVDRYALFIAEARPARAPSHC